MAQGDQLPQPASDRLASDRPSSYLTATVQQSNLDILRTICNCVLSYELKKNGGKLLSWTFSSRHWIWRVGSTSSRVRSSAYFPPAFFEATTDAESTVAHLAVPISNLMLALTGQQFESRVQFVLKSGVQDESVLEITGLSTDLGAYKFTAGLSPLIDTLQDDTWPETEANLLFDIRRQSPHIQVNPEVLYTVTNEMIGQSGDGQLTWTTFPYDSRHPNDPLLQWTLRRGSTVGSWDFLAEGLLSTGAALRDLDPARVNQIIYMPQELNLTFDLKVIYPILLTLKSPPIACELVFPPDGNLLICLAYAREGMIGQSEIATVTHIVTTQSAPDIPGPSPTASVRRMTQM